MIAKRKAGNYSSALIVYIFTMIEISAEERPRIQGRILISG